MTIADFGLRIWDIKTAIRTAKGPLVLTRGSFRIPEFGFLM